MVEFIPARKVYGVVDGVFVAAGSSFNTQSVKALELTFEGIPGDRHSGLVRKSNSREPWYERGTQMRNEQQVSILADDELVSIARDLDIDTLEPEWIGGNLLLSGIAHMSLLPPRTLLMFENGVTLRIDGDRGPCRVSGRSIAEKCPGRDDIEFAFPKIARHRRGLVAWVEVPGIVVPGEKVTARIWEQSIYPG